MYFTGSQKNLLVRLFNYFFIKKFFLFCIPLFICCSWERPVRIKGIFTLPKILEQAKAPAAGIDPCSSTVPSEPTAVNISSSSSPLSVSASWTNPKDCVPETVTVVRKAGSVPSDRNDGVSVPVNSDKSSFTDTGTVLNMLYYYKIFLGNKGGTYSKGTSFPVMAGSTSMVLAKIPDSSIVLDGMDSEPAWSNTPKISFSFPVVPAYSDYTGGNDLNVSGYIRFAYDSSYLYVFYHTDDKYLRADSYGIPWLDDSIELYFDMGYSRAAVLDSSHLGLYYTPLNGGSMKVYGSAGTWAASNLADDRIVCSPGTTLNNDTDIDAGWDMEIRIPYALLGVSSISSGKIVGFTFVINDDDLVNYNWDYHGYPWTSVTDIYVPYTWGILQFQ